MHVDIITRKVELSKADRNRAIDTAHHIVERFAGQVRRVLIRVTDVNAHKGGIDKRAVIEVALTGGGRMSAVRMHNHSGGAIGTALDVVRSKLRKRFGERQRQAIAT